MRQAPHGPFYPTPDFSSRSDPGDTRTWGTSSQGMGRGRWTQDEQGVQAISINLREPIQPWCPQCPVTDSRGLRHGCPGLESWLTDPFSATRSLTVAEPRATNHPLVCGVSCWYLNTLKSVPLWAWHASPPHLGPCPSGASSSFAVHLSASGQQKHAGISVCNPRLTPCS